MLRTGLRLYINCRPLAAIVADAVWIFEYFRVGKRPLQVAMTSKTQNDRLTTTSRAAAIEYAHMASVASIIIAATVLLLGDQILTLFQQITTAFGG